MEIKVRADILAVLTQSVSAIKRQDADGLAELSNQVTHSIFIFEDEIALETTITLYSLSKIIARNETNPVKNWDKHVIKITDILVEAKNACEEREDTVCLTKLDEIIKYICTIEDKMNLYIEAILKEVQIKKGAKLYEHGYSMGRVADILGISQWELMSYVGKTKSSDEIPKTRLVDARLRAAKRLFNA